MYTKAAVTSPRLLVGVAAVLCTLFVASVAAGEKIVTVSRHVSTEGLDLSQPADLRTFYTRLENAAWVVCTSRTSRFAMRRRSQAQSGPPERRRLPRSTWQLTRLRQPQRRESKYRHKSWRSDLSRAKVAARFTQHD